MKTKNAYLYIATGEGYISECQDSAKALKESNPDAYTVVYTDSKGKQQLYSLGIFSEIHEISNPQGGFHDKIQGMIDCDAENIIFLDTDTVPLDAFNLWGVLEKFDLAFVYDPIRWDYELPEIPEAFPTPNTGFLAFRKTSTMLNVLKRWLELYRVQLLRDIKPLHDQPAFRKAVYESDLKYLVLPCEYNLRVSFAYMIPGNVKVKMIHGRHDNLDYALKMTQRVEFTPRVYGGIYRKWELLHILKQNMWKRLFNKTNLNYKSKVLKD